jgi:hypothetical protein
MSLQNPEQVILDTKRFIESTKGSEITLKANGGNSILIVCEPQLEHEFIAAILKYMPDDIFQVIDLNSLLIQFVEANKEDLAELFELRQSSISQIFKLPDNEVGSDLFRSIIDAIKNSFRANKIPILIHSGALYGSGIENIHIMENELIMKSSLPLIVLYPSTSDGENLLFLSKRRASKYRCHVVNDFNSK